MSLDLTDEEERQILKQRQDADRRRYIVSGYFQAAMYLTQLGNECCGGSGADNNPETGKRFGEAYYDCAERLTRRASYLSANPGEINV